MFWYITTFVIIIGLFPLLQYIFYGKTKAMKHSRLFLPFIGLVFFASCYELIGTTILKLDARIWFKIYGVLEFFILLVVYNKLFSKKLRKFYVGFAVLYTITAISLFATGNFSGFFQGDAYLNSFTSILVLLSSIYWFVDSGVKFQKEKLWSHPHFYFITGLLLYFCGTYFLFLFGETIMETFENDLIKFWYINLFFSFVLRLSVSLALWKEWKN